MVSCKKIDILKENSSSWPNPTKCFYEKNKCKTHTDNTERFIEVAIVRIEGASVHHRRPLHQCETLRPQMAEESVSRRPNQTPSFSQVDHGAEHYGQLAASGSYPYTPCMADNVPCTLSLHGCISFMLLCYKWMTY